VIFSFLVLTVLFRKTNIFPLEFVRLSKLSFDSAYCAEGTRKTIDCFMLRVLCQRTEEEVLQVSIFLFESRNFTAETRVL
jgi:hypothetical protein